MSEPGQSTDDNLERRAAEGDVPTNGDSKADVNWDRLQGWCLTVAAVGLVLYAVSGSIYATSGEGRGKQFYTAWLTGWVYWLSLPVGSMVLLMIQYLTGGKWGVLMRRIFEAATRCLPLMIGLFIPLAAGVFFEEVSPYWWTGDLAEYRPDGVVVEEHEGPLGKAAAILNRPTVLTISGVALLFWGAVIYLLNSWSRKADADPNAPERERLKFISGPAILTHSVILTVVATVWVMSLEENWNSTMFPVIFGVNQLLTAYAFALGTLITLARNPTIGKDESTGVLGDRLKPLFQIDLGSLMLAFTLFWTYISFSQYMLVWVGNLPEEIGYIAKRQRGGWQFILIGLTVFHFAVPFLLLLFRHVKFNQKALRALAYGLVAVCMFDVFWWIEPYSERPGQYFYWLTDLGAVAGIGGLVLWMFIRELRSRPLLPVNEAKRLDEEEHHHD